MSGGGWAGGWLAAALLAGTMTPAAVALETAQAGLADAAALVREGEALRARGDLAGAGAAYQRAVSLLSALLARDPADPDLKRALAEARDHLRQLRSPAARDGAGDHGANPCDSAGAPDDDGCPDLGPTVVPRGPDFGRPKTRFDDSSEGVVESRRPAGGAEHDTGAGPTTRGVVPGGGQARGFGHAAGPPGAAGGAPPPSGAAAVAQTPGAPAGGGHHHRRAPLAMAPPPAPSAAAPPPGQPVIADARGQTTPLPVIYQPPKALILHQPVPFKLVIEGLGPGSSKGAFSGETTTATAQISRTVTATLTGPAGVTIAALSQATQTVTDLANPTWLWDVTAQAPDPATLVLSIKSHVVIDGSGQDVPIEVYNAQIPVQLSPIDRVTLWINQIDPVWKWLVGAIGVIGGALAWVLNLQAKLRRQKQPAAASPPTT